MIPHLLKQMSLEVGCELCIMIVTNYELKHPMMSHPHVKKIVISKVVVVILVGTILANLKN
jgi:hypothetical protein